MKDLKFKPSGVTLIELIIVTALIGVLATIFLNTYPASQGKARDTQRRSDLKQYQTALEKSSNARGGYYPATVREQHPSAFCSNLGLVNCPEDPRDGENSCSGGACRYLYVTDAEPNATSYGLWARLERPVQDEFSLFVICSNGRTGMARVNNPPTSTDTCPDDMQAVD